MRLGLPRLVANVRPANRLWPFARNEGFYISRVKSLLLLSDINQNRNVSANIRTHSKSKIVHAGKKTDRQICIGSWWSLFAVVRKGLKLRAWISIFETSGLLGCDAECFPKGVAAFVQGHAVRENRPRWPLTKAYGVTLPGGLIMWCVSFDVNTELDVAWSGERFQ